MDEQRIEAYRSLIQELLSCPGGEEPQVLNQHPELIDQGLVQVCGLVAEQLQEAGRENEASFLLNLAQQLAAYLNSTTNREAFSTATEPNATVEKYLNFLMALLQAEVESDSDATVVYPLLTQHQDKLDLTFAKIIKQWFESELDPNNSEKNYFLARTFNNFAIDIKNFPLGSRANNIEIAIACHEAALKVYTRQTCPEQWATTQNNLGTVYKNRIEGNRGQNIEQAIACYEAALQVYTPEVFPEQWATLQNNLGNAYSDRIEGNRGQNLEQAIVCYKAALQVRTSEAFPQQWAMTQNNLGNAYKNRIQGEGYQNLDRAIACYQAALQVLTQQVFPQQWAMTQNNLGNAYRARIQGDRSQNLEQAITCYQAALEVLTRKAFPEKWATIQNNLGNAYSDRIREERTQNIERAIACYEAALKVYTRQAFPQDWATLQNNLGLAYSDRIQGRRGKNLKMAIHFYQEALKIRTRTAFPQNHTETLNNLGFTYQAQSVHYTSDPAKKQTALENTYTTFAQAIESVEYLRGEIISGDQAKRQLNQQFNRLYLGVVEVCLELGNYIAAIEYADRSKARNLVELIATRDGYPGGEIPSEVRQRLQDLRQAINAEDRRLAQDPNPDYTYITQLRQESQAKFPYQPIKFQQIQSLLDEETAILEWYILPDKFLTFTLLPPTPANSAEQREEVPPWQSTSEDLNNLIDWANDYLNDYGSNKNQWQDQLSQRLEDLTDILHLDEILQTLFEKFPNCKKLILIPHRFLHLFPLHALPIYLPSPSGKETEGERKPLQEWFPKGVSYAPSCQLLQQAQKRPRPHFNQLFAIQNPTQDLAFTDLEVEAIQSYFNPHQVLKHDEAEKTALNLNNANCTHFSCHGYFNFNNPLKSALLLANSEFPPPPPDTDQTRYIPLQNGNLLDLSKCLTLEDILRLDLTNCRLVTLSACETGITDFTSTSDEYIGLPSGFILAGSANVVSSLWTVDDQSTALLMIRFYENLNNGATVSLALQNAQIWLRNATVEHIRTWSAKLPAHIHQEILENLESFNPHETHFASPYHWAAFCAIGQ